MSDDVNAIERAREQEDQRRRDTAERLSRALADGRRRAARERRESDREQGK
jgi:hypothetical protein